MAHKRGRPPTPLNPEASCAARLGAELRGHREAAGLTQQALADLIGYGPQLISEIERAEATPSRSFIAACDEALHAHGHLPELLPDALHERETARQERAAARRATRRAEVQAALRCDATHSEAGDDDVQPTDRRGLIEAGAAAALGIPLLGIGAAPTRAGEVDPGLPAHSARLLAQLGRLDRVLGPQDLLDTVRSEAARLAAQRDLARGELYADLLRVEARWAGFAAWLSNDMGRWRERDAWTERALALAQEAGYADMIAFTREKQSQWAAQECDGPRALTYAQTATRVPGTSASARALCALRAAHAQALTGDTNACERHVADSYGWIERAGKQASVPIFPIGCATHAGALGAEARCWLALSPQRAVGLYEKVLRIWPRDRMRDRGIHQARLALACAKTGELDRARAEGRTALAMQRATKSATAERELQQLGRMLKAA